MVAQLSRESDRMTPSEAVFAAWILAKGEKQLQGGLVARKIIDKVCESSLPLLSTKDLSILVWSMAKLSERNINTLGKIAIEIEKRIKLRFDLRLPLFEEEKSATQPNEPSKNEEENPPKDDEENNPEEGLPNYNYDFEPNIPNIIVDNSKYRQNESFSLQAIVMYMWSLGKQRVIDTEMTGPIFERMNDEGLVSKLSLIQIQMIVPTIIDTPFACKEELVDRIYQRLDAMLTQNQEKNVPAKDKPFANSLAIKTLLTQFPKLNQIIPARGLYRSLLMVFFETNPSPSPRFVSEIFWATGRMNLPKIPPSVCRKIEASIFKDAQDYLSRDIAACLYTLGILAKRFENKEIEEISLNATKLCKVLVNELTIKKGFLTPRERNLIKEVKAEIARYCISINKVIE